MSNTSPRPDLAPDPDSSREEMEAQQHEIGSAAVFEDDHGLDPSVLAGPLSTAGTDARAPIVVGVDQSFLLEEERAISAAVAMCGGSVVERVHAVTDLEIPYVPGLLAFREGGPILAALDECSVEADLALFDGSGRIHFREAGIATHVGVVRDLPAVGVAKSLLCGEPTGDIEGLTAGERVPIEVREADGRVQAPVGTRLGYAVQTKQYESTSRHVNPLYVSPGHRVGAETAAEFVLACCSGYKLPEPVRLADAYADEVKRDVR